uniref:DUF6535 domain-containing protein n=1 Tax=Moniliophthora roreri TaxID=221103 RepID=A0A0W0G972_MONRR
MAVVLRFALSLTVRTVNLSLQMGNRRISMDLKECALRLWEAGWTREDICFALDVGKSSLYRWKKFYEVFQSVQPPPSPIRESLEWRLSQQSRRSSSHGTWPSILTLEALALCQLHRDSFEKWGVSSFLSALPILLEVALLFFFVGVLDLLWNRHRVG